MAHQNAVNTLLKDNHRGGAYVPSSMVSLFLLDLRFSTRQLTKTIKLYLYTCMDLACFIYRRRRTLRLYLPLTLPLLNRTVALCVHLYTPIPLEWDKPTPRTPIPRLTCDHLAPAPYNTGSDGSSDIRTWGSNDVLPSSVT